MPVQTVNVCNIKGRDLGVKGAKKTEKTAEAAALYGEKLSSLGNVTQRSMFGGVGIFFESKMFALITSDGRLHFKVDDSNRDIYLAEGASQFGKMPYYDVPESVLKDLRKLRSWAKKSVRISQGSI